MKYKGKRKILLDYFISTFCIKKRVSILKKVIRNGSKYLKNMFFFLFKLYIFATLKIGFILINLKTIK